MAPTKGHLKKLAYLRLLLHHLPDSVPFCDKGLMSYNFSASEEDIADFGDKNSAVNHALEISFGDCFKTNGIVPIKEKGPGIITVVDVLHQCLGRDQTNACLALWPENLPKSAEEVYKTAGDRVPVTSHNHYSQFGAQERGRR